MLRRIRQRLRLQRRIHRLPIRLAHVRGRGGHEIHGRVGARGRHGQRARPLGLLRARRRTGDRGPRALQRARRTGTAFGSVHRLRRDERQIDLRNGEPELRHRGRQGQRHQKVDAAAARILHGQRRREDDHPAGPPHRNDHRTGRFGGIPGRRQGGPQPLLRRRIPHHQRRCGHDSALQIVRGHRRTLREQALRQLLPRRRNAGGGRPGRGTFERGLPDGRSQRRRHAQHLHADDRCAGCADDQLHRHEGGIGAPDARRKGDPRFGVGGREQGDRGPGEPFQRRPAAPEPETVPPLPLPERRRNLHGGPGHADVPQPHPRRRERVAGR